MWSTAVHDGDRISCTPFVPTFDDQCVESDDDHFVGFTHEWPWPKREGSQPVGEALLRARRWSHATPMPTIAMPNAAAAIAFGVG